MNRTTPLTWKSIAVLPPLIVLSILATLAASILNRLSLREGLALLLATLALAEIGYLVVLIATHRSANPPQGFDPSSER